MYVTHRNIPPSDAGVLLTADVMSKMVREARTDPPVRAAAAGILWSSGGRPDDFPAALARWLEAHTQLEEDPYNVELLRTPAYALQVIREDGVLRGDCDDVATLAAGLAEAAGFASRFVLLAWIGPWQHVYTEVLAPGPPALWVSMDIQRPQGPRPGPTREMFVYPL